MASNAGKISGKGRFFYDRYFKMIRGDLNEIEKMLSCRKKIKAKMRGMEKQWQRKMRKWWIVTMMEWLPMFLKKYLCKLLCVHKFRIKKFVRYKEGAEMYSMSERQFFKLAHDANAVIKYGKLVLINVEIIDRYLEYFRIEE